MKIHHIAPRRLRSYLKRKLAERIGPQPAPRPTVPQLWSIGIFEGPSVFGLGPSRRAANPVLTAGSVTDTDAIYLADPFLVREDGRWYMFFEVFSARTRLGEIAVAESENGYEWKYGKAVLREAFHLSYPNVFKSGADYYMIPETSQTRTARIYRAKRFPDEWEFVETLLSGRSFSDSTVFRHGGRWWMFTETSGALPFGELRLYGSDHLMSGWSEHPASPIVVDDPVAARPAGRVVEDGADLIRFSQNCATRYGLDVQTFRITTLTPEKYREEPASDGPVLKGSGAGWNQAGMHHVDAQPLDGGGLIASVDGWIDCTK